MNVKLSKPSHDLFMLYARDSWEWSGRPPIGGNVSHNKQANGYLLDWKKKGLVQTEENYGEVWMEFTKAGFEYALANGIDISLEASYEPRELPA